EAQGGSLGKGLGLLGTIIGMGIAAGLCGMGQGRVAAAACEGMARNPSAYNRVQLALILGLAFIETLVIFTLVVVLLNAPKPQRQTLGQIEPRGSRGRHGERQ